MNYFPGKFISWEWASFIPIGMLVSTWGTNRKYRISPMAFSFLWGLCFVVFVEMGRKYSG